jgi:autotransporter-associated beta strand protein
MNTLIVAAIRCLLMFLVPALAYAGSAEWNLNPTSDDWNTAANWTPMTVPNGPADTATFALSNTTDVSFSANTTLDGITFSPGASSFTFTATTSVSLTLSGAGITNNSGTTQNFVTANPNGLFLIEFSNSATAGSQTVFTNEGSGLPGSPGLVFFRNSSTADNATFINNGGTFDGADGGDTVFLETSTAANGTFINNGGAASGLFGGGSTTFTASSTADNATFINNGGTVDGADGGVTYFFGTSTAGSATIINNGATVSGAAGGFLQFGGRSTAGSSTLVENGGSNGGGGGTILFTDQSTVGTAHIELFGNGSVDISFHGAPGMTINSIEGDGNVFLGANNLTVGSDNLNTTFACAIQDGGRRGGVGGSLTKIGTGTLILSGANTYTGNTNVNGGVLKVDGSITGNTFVDRSGTDHSAMLAGTGIIHSSVTNNGRVSPGALGVPGMLTVVHDYTQTQFAALMIQMAGVSAGQFGVLNVLGTANLSGRLDPVLLNGFVPTIGQSFTFLNYAAVNGTLSIIDPNIDSEPEHWVISYQPTYAILTVAPGNVHVPDQGSTFVLLALGLLGLVTFRRHLLRGRP